MKVMFDGKEIGTVASNHSMTVEEALYCMDIDINSQEDCKKAYDDGEPYAYIDDCGNYAIDVENITLDR